MASHTYLRCLFGPNKANRISGNICQISCAQKDTHKKEKNSMNLNTYLFLQKFQPLLKRVV